jgi:hypothetical protein
MLTFREQVARISGYEKKYAMSLLRAAGLGPSSSKSEIRAFFRERFREKDRAYRGSHGLIEINGETRSFASWCRVAGIRQETAIKRVLSHMRRTPGISRDEARSIVMKGIVNGDMDFPQRGGVRPSKATASSKEFEIDGVRRTVAEWARIARVPKADMRLAVWRSCKRGSDPTESIRRYLRRAGIAA